MEFDLGMFIYSFVLVILGAAAILLGQAIQEYNETWRCPKCQGPQRYTVRSKDKEAREYIGNCHIRDDHSQ
jgi:hypothetical protein